MYITLFYTMQSIIVHISTIGTGVYMGEAGQDMYIDTIGM